MNVISFFLFFLFFFCSFTFPNLKEVHYTYSGNHKAYLYMPNIVGKLPVIIYNYDQFYDWAGPFASKSLGYDLLSVMRLFSDWGAITIIPLNRFRNLKSIQGAINYAKSLPNADVSQIHLMGLAEGATLSLFSLSSDSNIKSLILVAPDNLESKGALSISNFVRNYNRLTMPILFLSAAYEKKYKIEFYKYLLSVLNKYDLSITIKEYPLNRKGFWSTTHKFNNDIYFKLPNSSKQFWRKRIELDGTPCCF